jgi:mevalonate kinase
LAAKLTGAGGGGCAFALCDNPADASALIEALRSRFPELAKTPETSPFAVEVET